MILRIVLERKASLAITIEQREKNENYVREIFSGISNKMFIHSIWTEEHQINVAYYKRTGCAGINFKELIENTIEGFPDITLISLQVPGNIIKVHGLTLFEQTESVLKYKVFPLFFKKLAIDDYYRSVIAHKKVVEISYELEQFENVQDVFYSALPIEEIVAGPVLIESSYNKLAQYLSENISVRNDIADKNCIGLELYIKCDNSIELALVDALMPESLPSIK